MRHHNDMRGHALQNHKGFTLIELLVVISVMSLLASIVLVATNNVRSLARDSQRIQAIAMIQTSLELYYDDHGQYPGNKCPIDTGSAKITDYDTLGVTGNAGNVNYNLKWPSPRILNTVLYN